jgi:hypothetical protein
MRPLHPTMEELANENGQWPFLVPGHTFVVPPVVEVMEPPSADVSAQEEKHFPWLCYPMSPPGSWPHKSETSNVLREFLKLASDTNTKKDSERVRTFAATWGPLWLCQTPGHRGLGVAECIYSGSKETFSRGCSWSPRESVATFVRKAREAEAAIRIAARLRGGAGASEASWCVLGIERHRCGLAATVSHDPVPVQRQVLALIITQHLAAFPFGIRPIVTWEKASAKLKLLKGSGFLSAVWLEIAQAVCHVNGIYCCEQCSRIHERQGRKPQAGRGVYCPECGESANWKESKRQSAARKREQLRQDNKNDEKSSECND